MNFLADSGTITTIKNSGFKVYTWFYVIDKLKTGNLLSKNTAEKLKILRTKAENINNINSKSLENKDIIIERCKGIFEGIGKLKDFELTPVVQPSRKISYNLRHKLLEKLIELEENDIIEKVKSPMTWVSPLVIIPKCNGDICIILDVRFPKQAIKRERHPIPTVEEIVQEVSGDCHFSKLDLRSG